MKCNASQFSIGFGVQKEHLLKLCGTMPPDSQGPQKVLWLMEVQIAVRIR